MQNLHLSSPIVAITSNKQSFAICSEEGTIYIGDSNKRSVDIEIALPAESELVTNLMWANPDGDNIYASSNDTMYFFKPQQNATVESVQLPSKIVNVFPHCDGFSAIAQLHDNSLCNVKPDPKNKSFAKSDPFLATERIISVVTYHKTNLAVIVSGQEPQIRFLDTNTLAVINSINIEKTETEISAAFSTPELGIVVIWVDGFWVRYNISFQSSNDENLSFTTVSGRISPGNFYNLRSYYLCVSCEDRIKIFDLQFDAELQRIDLHSDKCIIFQSNVLAVFDTEVYFRDWKGLKTTTTRDLIMSRLAAIQEAQKAKEIAEEAQPKEEKKSKRRKKGQKPEEVVQTDDQPNYKEINIEFELSTFGDDQPVQAEVIQKIPDCKFKSVSNVIDNIMDNKLVPLGLRKQVLEQLNQSDYDDVRDLAYFHLATSIPFDEIMKALTEKNMMNVVMMLKKVEPLNGSNAALFIREALTDLERNEIPLVHFLTQPLSEKAVIEASKILNVEEVDALLSFLAKILASRRYWREFNASLSAFDAVNWWGSILIKNNVTSLALQKKTKGLKELQEELIKETERIKAAGKCWSIVETIHDAKAEAIPPSFMYLVETLDIPE